MAGRPATPKYGIPNYKCDRQYRQSMFRLRHAAASPPGVMPAAPSAKVGVDVGDIIEHSNNTNKSAILDQEPKNLTANEEVNTPSPTLQDDPSIPSTSTSDTEFPCRTSFQKVGHSGDIEAPLQEKACACLEGRSTWVEKLKRLLREKNEKPFPMPYVYVPTTLMLEEEVDTQEKCGLLVLQNMSGHDVTFMVKGIPSKKCDRDYVNWIPKGGFRAVNFHIAESFAYVLRQRTFVFTVPTIGQVLLNEASLRLYWGTLGSELLPYSVVECQKVRPVARYNGDSMLYKISCISPYPEKRMPCCEVLEVKGMIPPGSVNMKPCIISKLEDPWRDLWAKCLVFFVSTFVIHYLFTLADVPPQFGVQDFEKFHEFVFIKILHWFFPPPPPDPEWYEYLFFWDWEWNEWFNYFIRNFY